MTVEITCFDQGESDTWNEYVEESVHGTTFHRHEALDLFARQSDTSLYTLVGYKGQEPVGILPLFSSTRGPFRSVRSPPELEVFTLGPALLNLEKLSQRKRERRHRGFVDGCLDWVEAELAPDYVDIRTVAGYRDVRPFAWRGYDVSPTYTYHVDLTSPREAILEGFSSDARRNVRNVDKTRYEVDVGGINGVRTIVEQIEDRHNEQERAYPLDSTFVARLYEELPDDRMRAYTLTVDGNVAGGIVTIESDDVIRRWQGGATPDVDLPVNDLLDWHVMTDAKERGREWYDLVGANLPHLCRYKAKFNPEPVAYYVAQWRSSRIRAASAIYNRLPGGLKVM